MYSSGETLCKRLWQAIVEAILCGDIGDVDRVAETHRMTDGNRFERPAGDDIPWFHSGQFSVQSSEVDSQGVLRQQ